jgi:hypothetical protein
MNIKEIYVLNTALDGKQIFYLPDFDKLHMSDLLLDDVKELMVEKGLLESASSLTMEGVKITKRMEDFKKAKKYIKLGPLVIGIKDKNEGVLLKYIPEYGDYSFERIDLAGGALNLIKSYSFLQEAVNYPESREPKRLTIEEVQNKYDLDIYNCIYLSTIELRNAKEAGEVRVTNEMIFTFERNLYLYDRDSELLLRKGHDEILILMEERMTA